MTHLKNQLSRKRLRSSMLILTSLILFSFTSAKRPVHIFMAGDSTMADKPYSKTIKDPQTGNEITEAFPERGWGMMLPGFFTDKVVIENYAKNGRSTRTFIEEGLWSKIEAGVKKGDYVIIQFGHNDSSEQKKDRYTPPADYKKNLIRFIDETRAKGGIPILCTPVVRRKFDSDGKIADSHGVYTELVRQTAKEKKVLLVDMHELTRRWINDAGVDASAAFFMHIPPGVNKLYPEGLTDNTHFVESGARKTASLFVEDIKNQNIKGLAKFLKKNERP